MRRETVIRISGAFFLMGLFFSSYNFAITGNVVLDVNNNFSIFPLIGAIFFMMGILILVSEVHRLTLDTVIEQTKSFKKATKRAPPKEISSAIAKIGTGLGNEHPLNHEDDLVVIKTSKGGRIVARVEYGSSAKTYHLVDYFPDHKDPRYNYH